MFNDKKIIIIFKIFIFKNNFEIKTKYNMDDSIPKVTNFDISKPIDLA